jgi:3'(2'), 5'-bisphosphate nucleotidase
METEIEALLALMTQTALAAARRTLACRSDGVIGKTADKAVEKAMLETLAARPDIRILSEETPEGYGYDFSDRLAFVIDPIDGTNAFDRGSDEFANCVALMQGRHPIAGVICSPCHALLTRGDRFSSRVDEFRVAPDISRLGERTQLTAECHAGEIRAVIGRSEMSQPMLDYLAALGVGSLGVLDSALCFSHVLRGGADIFVRLGPNMEWDIAAGHALLSSIGGDIYDLTHQPMTYGKPGLRNHGFMAAAVPIQMLLPTSVPAQSEATQRSDIAPKESRSD